MENTVIIFGAGATKACGGPMTNEILRRAFDNAAEIEREDFLTRVREFIDENFFPSGGEDSFPPLPLLISVIDTAIDRKHSLNQKWDNGQLIAVREALDYVIFAVLNNELRKLQTNCYQTLLQKLYADNDAIPSLISLNYDIIADNALAIFNERHRCHEPPFPNYHCDIATPTYRNKVGHAHLLKLHGSLNWLYCPSCNRLDVGLSNSERSFAKVLEELYSQQEAEGNTMEARLSCHGRPCRSCNAEVQPVLISPTYFKDYRNPHISRIWYEADQMLRTAERVIIIGYSLPDDDLDVLYLLKRGLAHLGPEKIDIVDSDAPKHRNLNHHPTGQRYQTLFGPNINWHTNGFEAFIEEL